jgi:hypothetical protein
LSARGVSLMIVCMTLATRAAESHHALAIDARERVTIVIGAASDMRIIKAALGVRAL